MMKELRRYFTLFLILLFLCGMGIAFPAKAGVSLTPGQQEPGTSTAGSLSPSQSEADAAESIGSGAESPSLLTPNDSAESKTGPSLVPSTPPSPEENDTNGDGSEKPGEGEESGENGTGEETSPSSPDVDADNNDENGEPDEGDEENSLNPDTGEESTEAETLAPSLEGAGVMPLATTPWGGDGIIVETYQELADALNQDNGYNKIYLGADVSGDYSGAPNILVHANKRDVVICGRDPRPNGARHSLTAKRGASLLYGIRVESPNISSLTFDDIDMYGLNMYGICQFPDNIAFTNAGFKVTMRNATYSGPQMFFGINVILRLENFTYNTVLGLGSIGAYEEVAELYSLELAGDVTINHRMGADPIFSMFYFRAGGSGNRTITVESGAKITMTTDNYFVFTENNTVDLIVQGNAQFSLTARKGCYDNSVTQRFRNVIVEENGSFTFMQVADTSKAVGNISALNISGELLVKGGSSFVVQRSGSTLTVPLIYFSSTVASASFLEPAFVQLTNPWSALMGFSANNRPMQLAADTVNIWQGALPNTSDDINNMPTAIWNKHETALPVSISAVYSTAGAASGISHNLTSPPDPLVEPVDSANLNMNTARQITMGNFTLTGEAKTSGLSGVTEANADMIASYGSPATTLSGTADGSGAYNLPGVIPAGEIVTLLSHSKMLKARLVNEAEQDQDQTLRFEYVPPILDFGTVSIQAAQQSVFRQDPAWYMQIYDGRGAGSTWKVQASIAAPLFCNCGSNHTLPNALVYVNGGSTDVFSATEILIYNGVTAGPPMTPTAYSDIGWAATEGPQLNIGPGQGVVGDTYSTAITWTLYDAP